MSIIEALASSLPVIVSQNVANYREIEEDYSGLIVETSVSAIHKLLLKIETDKIDNELLVKNAQKAAKQRYDISVIAQQMKKNYERIINE